MLITASSNFLHNMKGPFGSKLHREVHVQVKQWLYRMWSRCSAPKRCIQKFDPDPEVKKHYLEVFKKTILSYYLKVSNINSHKAFAAGISRVKKEACTKGWKSRRRSVSRSPWNRKFGRSFSGSFIPL